MDSKRRAATLLRLFFMVDAIAYRSSTATTSVFFHHASFGVMDFIPISTLREVSGYRDRRSITKWVQQVLCIQLHKVGRNWCVVREEYETAIRLRFQSTAPSMPSKGHYVPANEHEQNFLAELQDLLAHNKEL